MTEASRAKLVAPRVDAEICWISKCGRQMEQLCVVDIHGKKTEQDYGDILWQGLFVSEGCRGGFCGKTPGTASMLRKVPAGSKADPLLAKAEPISNIHDTSVVIDLRKGKKMLCSSCERGVRGALPAPGSVRIEGAKMLQVLE